MPRFARRLSLLSLWLALCLPWLASCAPAASIPDIYRPPPAPVAATGADLAGGAISQPEQPGPTPECTNNLRFIEDQTIPDGTVIQPGEMLDKQWLVQNDGTCNWDALYRLRLVSGPEMGVPAEQSLYPARGGTQASLRIAFTAPLEPGSYQSAWQAYDPQGQPFGDAVYISIVVP